MQMKANGGNTVKKEFKKRIMQRVAIRSGVQTQVAWVQIADPNLRITLPKSFLQQCASSNCKSSLANYFGRCTAAFK